MKNKKFNRKKDGCPFKVHPVSNGVDNGEQASRSDRKQTALLSASPSCMLYEQEACATKELCDAAGKPNFLTQLPNRHPDPNPNLISILYQF